MISLLFEYSLALTRYEEAAVLNERGSAAKMEAAVGRIHSVTARMRDGYRAVPAADLRLRRRLLEEIAYSVEVFGMTEFASFLDKESSLLPPALSAEELADLSATITSLSALAESDPAAAFEKLRAILLLAPEERETLTPSLESLFTAITLPALSSDNSKLDNEAKELLIPNCSLLIDKDCSLLIDWAQNSKLELSGGSIIQNSKFKIQNYRSTLELIADSARLLWYELPASRPLLERVATRLAEVAPTSPATIPLAVYLSLRALIARLLAA